MSHIHNRDGVQHIIEGSADDCNGCLQFDVTSLLDSPTAIWREVSALICGPAIADVNDEEVKLAVQDALDAGDELIAVWDYPNMPPGKLTIERAAGIAGYIEGRLHALGFTDLEVTFTRTDHDTNWVISLPGVDDDAKQVMADRSFYGQ